MKTNIEKAERLIQRANANMKSRVRSLRTSFKITQKELAKIIGVSHAAVSKYEAGQAFPSDEVLEKMCKYFDVHPDYIRGNIDDYGSSSQSVTSTFTSTLRFLRENIKYRKFTCDDVAKHLNMKKDDYIALEIGVVAPDIDTLIKLSLFFDVSVDFLIKGENYHETVHPIPFERFNLLNDKNKKRLLDYFDILSQVNKD